ncbi:MAG TPA: UDP-3-O-(3-hydroxymyristoyl)glucosamine N-acyltransferase [Elusimicrobia bacterium]|nr:UDP-3-O-(3-hydroxymyristoyl)glucosamine N-acyltransferase [Elusimicrobiota bacterium]
MKTTLGELAKLTGAELEGDASYTVTGAAGLADAGPADVSFLENPKYAPQVETSRAGAVFLPASSKGKVRGGPAHRLFTEEPKWGYAQWLALLETERRRPEAPQVSPRAEVHREAVLGKDVHIGPFAVVGARTIVGDRAVIGPGCSIGYNARVGKDCRLHPNVVLEDFCELGDRVTLHAGTVIGSDGFGYCTDPKTGEHRKFPQIGRVVIENDVEIGSNVSIDRATTGETRIGAGTKIDNLVQIGHNVIIGPNGLLVSQVGVAGSTKIGRQVILAGQAGLVGHITIGDGAIIMAQTGVMDDVPSKQVLFGSPGRPRREAMKLQVLLSKLPEMVQTLKELKARILRQEHSAHDG